MDNFRKTLTGLKALDQEQQSILTSRVAAGELKSTVWEDFENRGYEVNNSITGYTPTQIQNKFLRTNLGAYEGTYLEPLFNDDFSGGLGYRDVRTGEQIWMPKYAVEAINTSYAEYAAGNWQPGTQQKTNTQATTVTSPDQAEAQAAAPAEEAGSEAAGQPVKVRPTSKRTSRASLTLSDINPNASTLLGQ